MLRGKLAILFLVFLVLAYCCEMILGTATTETHEQVWTVLGLSALFTGVAIAWHAIRNRKG